MCLDNYGQYILPGRRFQPISSDHCTQCLCINGKPNQCLTIKCQPPDNCKKSAILQKKGSCCEFICLNSDEEEEINKSDRSSKSIQFTNQLKPMTKEFSESTNKIVHLNQANDLEMNGNKKIENVNSLSKAIDSRDDQLNNAQNQPIESIRKQNDTQSNDKRFSNLENTIKKLITTKNTFKTSENDTYTVAKSNEDDRTALNPKFQNLGIAVGIGSGNRESSEDVKQSKSQRINYSSNYQTIYSPPRNKYSSTLGNEQFKSAGKKYGVYGANIYHNNLGNGITGYNHPNSSSQYPDEYPYVTLNDFIRNRQTNRNNFIHHQSTGNGLNHNGSYLWFNAQNLGLRLIASTLCTVLIIGLLFFLIHRLRQRRLMAMIRSKFFLF